MTNKDKNMNTNNDRVLVARVASAHGIKGLVKMQSFTANPDDFADYSPLFDENGNDVEFEIVGEAKGQFLVQIEGINNRNDAEDLKGMQIFTSRAGLGDLDEDEYFLSDLVGLNIVDSENKVYGKVVKVSNYGSCDLLEVKTENGKSFLVPMIEEKVELIDFDNDQIVVADIAELLSLGGIKDE